MCTGKGWMQQDGVQGIWYVPRLFAFCWTLDRQDVGVSAAGWHVWRLKRPWNFSFHWTLRRQDYAGRMLAKLCAPWQRYIYLVMLLTHGKVGGVIMLRSMHICIYLHIAWLYQAPGFGRMQPTSCRTVWYAHHVMCNTGALPIASHVFFNGLSKRLPVIRLTLLMVQADMHHYIVNAVENCSESTTSHAGWHEERYQFITSLVLCDLQCV